MKSITNNIKQIAAVLMILLVITSCNDWLSIAPENDLIKEKFWSKKADADGALAAAYNAFRDAALESFIWGELRADIAEFSGNSFADYNSIASSNISITNPRISWSKYYNAINLANTFMYFADEVVEKDKSFTAEMKQAYDAEMLFIRALSYFYLVRLWKEVPLVIDASVSDQGDLFLPKSTEREIIDQIIADLTKAKGLAYTDELRDTPEYYKGRANKYSIMALMADVYLWDEQYQNCINYCDSIINTGKFGLVDYNDYFKLYNPGNSMVESIFEIQFDSRYEGQSNPIYNDVARITGTVNLKMKAIALNILFNKEDMRLFGTRTPAHKYLGIDPNSSTKRTNTQRDANFIYYRYADILLSKAEALTELNQLNEANALLRQVVERVGFSHVEITRQTELRDQILNERAREFVFEGKRWFDILRHAKRNNFQNKHVIINMILSGADIKQQAILRTRVYDEMSYYLPIPERELLYNPNLVQNPFYDR